MRSCSNDLLHLLEDQVNGTARVDVYKINGCVRIDELGTFGHGISMRATHLNSKEILRAVSLQQGPLTLLALRTDTSIINTVDAQHRKFCRWVHAKSARSTYKTGYMHTCKRFVHIAISPQVMSVPSSLQTLRNGRFPTWQQNMIVQQWLLHYSPPPPPLSLSLSITYCSQWCKIKFALKVNL